MKKLLGGIFHKKGGEPASAASSAAPSPAGSAAVASSGPPPSRPSGVKLGVNSPNRTGLGSTWESFFLPAGRTTPPTTPPLPSSSSSSSSLAVPTPAKVFNQNLEVLMREIVTKIKLVINRMMEDEDFSAEVAQLCGFINLAADKLLESGDPSLLLLRNYFSSSAGAMLCDQTAFPSLVLDFVNKVRVHLIKEELRRLETPRCRDADPARQAIQFNVDLERPIHFLMSCVQAIASNVMLMEQFRCELPNLIYLTAEDYPSDALYLRDLACQALGAIGDKNFNAGLVWYLNDCSVIGRAVRLITRNSEAPIATTESAPEALQALAALSKTTMIPESTPSHEPLAAAVSDALGFNRQKDDSADECRPCVPVSIPKDAGQQHSFRYHCASSFDPLPGIKSLVYVLQKTCRFSLVLLGEFQSSGGYDLLSSLVKHAHVRRVSELLYMFTLLLPLGTGFSGTCTEAETMATILTSGARNIGAFIAIRDLVLDCISTLENTGVNSRERIEGLLLQLLTNILQVYTSSYENFLCLEQKTQALAMIASKFAVVAFFDARVIILRIVEYVCVAARPDSPLPHEILAVLSSQLIEFSRTETIETIEKLCGSESRIEQSSSVSVVHTCSVNNDSPASLLCDCVIKILQDSTISAYREDFNSFGLLERGAYSFFVKVASSLSGTLDKASKQQVLMTFSLNLSKWSALTCLMLKNNLQLCVELREMQIHHSIYIIAESLLAEHDNLNLPQTIKLSKNHLPVLWVLIELVRVNIDDIISELDGAKVLSSKNQAAILQNGVESDLSKLLELLQSARGFLSRQLLLLDVIKQMLKGGVLMWRAWRQCQGLQILVALLSSVEYLVSDDKFFFMDGILEILCTLLDPQYGDQSIRQHFQNEIGYSTISSCLIASGVLETANLEPVLSRVFELITGQLPPRNKIRNPEAVETLFHLVSSLPADSGETVLSRLLSKIVSNDDISFSRKRQITSLVHVGAFRWFAKPAIVAIITGKTSQLQGLLISLLIELSREQLTTSHLREFLRVIAVTMPLLLGNYFHPSVITKNLITSDVEVGVRLLQHTLSGPRVPQVVVGTTVQTHVTSCYVHVVNNRVRQWPPSGGYSFAAWVRFPPRRQRTSGTSLPSDCSLTTPTVCVALCEGPLKIKLDGDETDSADTYCVLVGAELSLFMSRMDARRDSNVCPLQTLTITAVERSSECKFAIWCHERLYIAESGSVDATDMWMRALQQSEHISNRTGKHKSMVEALTEEELLFVSEDLKQPPASSCAGTLDGFVCLLSVYSIEYAGCFTRIFFEQSTGCLRIDTGSVSSGPNMNPGPKRTSITFKNVNLDLLRLSGNSSNENDAGKEKVAQWHHLAFSHRKAALGSSLLTLFIDGAEVGTKKLTYPSAPSAGTMQAFIGKDIQICGTYPALSWCIGPTWMCDETISSNAVACIFLLGPSFSGQFSGHSYRSIGDWPEAIASGQLDRATKRRVEVNRAARRLQLLKLCRASKRQWYEVSASNSTDHDISNRRDDVVDGASKLTDAKRKQLNVDEFSSFVNFDCSLSSFGNEILHVLSSFKLTEDSVLLTINTALSREDNKNLACSPHYQFVGTEPSSPLDIAQALPSLGGVVQVFFPLLENSWRSQELTIMLKLLTKCMRRNPSCLAECLEANGYAYIASLLCSRAQLLDPAVLVAVVNLAVCMSKVSVVECDSPRNPMVLDVVVDFSALTVVVLSRHLLQVMSTGLKLQMIDSMQRLISTSNPNSIFNARQLRRAGFLNWIMMFLGDVCSETCTLDIQRCLDMRNCVPAFENEELNALLGRLLALLTEYIQLEPHVDDVQCISEVIMVSMSNHNPFSFDNPFRVVLLQLLLHLVEDYRELSGDEGRHSKIREAAPEAVDSFGSIIVDAVITRGIAGEQKKKKERFEASLASPTSVSTSILQGGDGFNHILVEVIRRSDAGCFSSVEALLATRLLLTLAQDHSKFARHVLQSRPFSKKLTGGLQTYSTDCNFFTPLLAFISNIPIKDTKYNDPMSGDGAKQFALPTPCAFRKATESQCINDVWQIIGALLIKNCELGTPQANRVFAVVITQLSFQTEVSEAFFEVMCHSYEIVLRLLVECLLCGVPVHDSVTKSSTNDNPSPSQLDAPSNLEMALTYFLTGRTPDSSYYARAVSCFDLLKVFVTRSLFDADNFAMYAMYVLECMDDEISKVQFCPAERVICTDNGQKCWLALLVHIIKETKAMSDNCAFVSLRNVCSLCLALARYLADERNHQGAIQGCESVKPQSVENTVNRPACFGIDVLVFFFSTIRKCGDTRVAQVVGADDQQFFYGCLVYCGQLAVLYELAGVHRSTSPSQRLLDCLLASRHLLLQQTKVSGVLICGNGHHNIPSDGDPPTGSVMTGISGHLTRMRSLSTNIHKEFGIGAESDRSFILSLAAEIFRWLVDDSEAVRYASITLWQFLIQQRMGVLKELLIVEPKASLLQNISANKKEVIDVFHGGFERLLQIIPPNARDDHERNGSGQLTVSRESWLQFHLWLTENHELLNELIIIRTEPMLNHLTEVFLSSMSVRKVNLNGTQSRLVSQNELTINLDFPQFDNSPNGDDGSHDDSDLGVRLAARRATVKLANATESAIEAMVDSTLKWREQSVRLWNTRAIWHLGKWNEAVRSNYSTQNEKSSSSHAEPFYVDRSIFQQDNYRYKLDFTEGPQRMRLRLIRSYTTEVNAQEQMMDFQCKEASCSSTVSVDTVDTSTAQAHLMSDFLWAVEAFRTTLYKQSLSQCGDTCENSRSYLAEIENRAGSSTLKTIFSDEGIDEARPVGVTIASRIVDAYLGKSASVPVSAKVLDEISRCLSIPGINGSGDVPPTLFDVAEIEVMQTSLGVSIKNVGISSCAELDDDEDDDEGALDENANEQVPESDSDEDMEPNHEDPGYDVSKKAVQLTTSEAPQGVPSTDGDKSNSRGEMEFKVVEGSEDQLFDDSIDYVFGGIARFIHRNDYPPLHCHNVSYVAGMSKTPGVFLVCKNAVYFIGGYGKVLSDSDVTSPPMHTAAISTPVSPSSTSASNPLSPTKATKRKAKDILRETFADIGLSFPNSKSSGHQLYTVVPLSFPCDLSTASPTCGKSDEYKNAPAKRWNIQYSDIKQFYRIKYQLRPVGIEFFDVLGSTYFVQFESTGEREGIVKLLFQMPIVNSVFWNPVLRSSALSLSVKRIRQSITKRWVKGYISNFEYLMHLNTLAGRSFNDLTQYPVFPWVLADYTSTFLDFDSPSTFRDLSKPMGALGDTRAALFRERFAAMSDIGQLDSPAFHYGTHYSCSAYVINFLIRLDPFSQLAKDLQGGCFDHADRLFRSIPSSWESASTENLQDVRELIPEFYFLPEFLVNANHYDLGTTQSGELVNHVKLPQWAHGDAREFIRLHRRALESKYVSEHLHHWIDLIFGYRQTGDEALASQNVFMHFTYEGAVDIDEIEDPIMRNATLAQIENFGQTPSKLFLTPHPARRVPVLNPPVTTGGNSIGHQFEGNTMSHIEAFIKWHTALAPPLVTIGKDYVHLKKLMSANLIDATVGDVKVVGERFFCRSQGSTFIPPRYTKYLEWGVNDGTMKLRVHQSSARHREANKIVGIIEGAHYSRVQCAAFTADGVVLVTGGDDAVVNVLECTKSHGQRLFRQLAKLVGHSDAVVCIAVEKELNLIASGSADCGVILWDLRTRSFLRELVGHSSTVSHVGINPSNGNIFTATCTELRLWSVNGDLLAAITVQAVGLGNITSSAITRCETWQDGVVAVTGHVNGTIALWGLHYPADLAKERLSRETTDSENAGKPTSAYSSGTLRSAVRIGMVPENDLFSPAEATQVNIVKAIPTCQLFVMKLLMDHRVPVTALTVGTDQRQLISADAEGNCIRWVDDSISTNLM